MSKSRQQPTFLGHVLGEGAHQEKGKGRDSPKPSPTGDGHQIKGKLCEIKADFRHYRDEHKGMLNIVVLKLCAISLFLREDICLNNNVVTYFL